MNVKKILLTIAVALCTIVVNAQDISEYLPEENLVIANEDSCNTEAIQAAINACIMLADSSVSKDSIALTKVAKSLKDCNLIQFDNLRPILRQKSSLNGHLVFDESFAKALADGDDPYPYADNFYRANELRGLRIHQKGEIMTKTCVVEAKGKSWYEFNSIGRQELAVVAEPGGLVTTRIHVYNNDKGIDEWHNDTVDVAKGRSSRKAAFDLPEDTYSDILLEIKNCTDKRISVVVISN